MKTMSLKTLGFAAICILAAPIAAQSAELKIMTGPQGGSWIPLGGQLKDMWEKGIPGLAIQAFPGAGIANVRGVDEGKADVGFGNSISTVDGLAGRPPYPKATTNVCNLATLYPQYYQLAVNADSGIDKVADLKGKSVTTQQKGNTGELITRQLLEVNGIKYSDVKVSFVSYTDSVNQMKDGHAVAFGLIVSLFQSPALRREIPHLAPWVIANVVGWTLGAYLSQLAAGAFFQSALRTTFSGVLVSVGITGLVAGAVTDVALVWIGRQPDQLDVQVKGQS